MKYKVLGDRPIWGDDVGRIVKALRSRSYRPRPTVAKFMKDIAHRCYAYDRSVIRYDNVRDFVSDLIEHQYLIPIEDEPNDNVIQFPTTNQ